MFKVTEETDARAPGSENIVCVPDITQAVTTISPPSFDTVSYTYDMESPYGGREVPPSSDSTLTHVQGSIANTSRRYVHYPISLSFSLQGKSFLI